MTFGLRHLEHLLRSLGIWLPILPFALVQNSGWLTIIWTPMIAYGVSGMEKVAMELSDPFGYDSRTFSLFTVFGSGCLRS
jgi:predicted membrane chloride channel (bestrophin family)